ncbi:hypothetical protein CROQUDRAFT_48157 [Cronartium quercuum f. sp. fusiforme G11]|uniref:Large ribosomal subunit protein bL32m n=1 Tax=Cronartium quercuum f. sp. fusiforme G11 TaxID=708437 RepID=A0A9P6NHV2_9BASI|nr:hypothetical protein CROQUDRAFT_48157 [Cronartium quercuum f. sp. fusiforme G11]
MRKLSTTIDFNSFTNSNSLNINNNRLNDWSNFISEWISSRILKAVPKKKVSHSRKRMRSAHKGLKPDLGLSNCSGCGQSKRKHHLCLNCYAEKVLEWNRNGRRPWDMGITH